MNLFLFKLQEDFAAGRLKPGLNVAAVKKVFANDVVRFSF